MLTPSIPFSQVSDLMRQRTPERKGKTALEMVRSMSDDQVRYAMWCVLVVLFGSPESNSVDLLSDFSMRPPANTKEQREAITILAEAGLPSRPDVADGFRNHIADPTRN